MESWHSALEGNPEERRWCDGLCLNVRKCLPSTDVQRKCVDAPGGSRGNRGPAQNPGANLKGAMMGKHIEEPVMVNGKGVPYRNRPPKKKERVIAASKVVAASIMTFFPPLLLEIAKCLGRHYGTLT